MCFRDVRHCPLSSLNLIIANTGSLQRIAYVQQDGRIGPFSSTVLKCGRCRLTCLKQITEPRAQTICVRSVNFYSVSAAI
jgi:hypothetical protein